MEKDDFKFEQTPFRISRKLFGQHSCFSQSKLRHNIFEIRGHQLTRRLNQEIALDVLLSLGFSRETVARILDRITVTGSSEPLLPCVFRITDSATAMHVCLAVLANLYGLERQGYLQDGTVDADNASLMFCLSTAWEWYGRQLFPGKLEGPKEKPLFYSDGIPALSGFPPQTGVTRFLAAYRQVFETGDKRYLFVSDRCWSGLVKGFEAS